MPHVHPDDSVSSTNNVSALPVPSNFFCRSTTGFLTPQEMVFALAAGIQFSGGVDLQAFHFVRKEVFGEGSLIVRPGTTNTPSP